MGDDAAAIAARQRLAPLLETTQDPYLHAVSRLAIAWTSAIVGDVDSALREAAGSLEELRGQDEPLWTAAALITLGSLETAAGRYDDALRHLREAHDLAERFGNDRLITGSQIQLGILAVMRQRPEEARAVLDQALELSLAIHSTRNMILCLTTFAQLAFEEGDPERATLLAGSGRGPARRARYTGLACRAAFSRLAGRPGPPGAGGREVRADIRRRCPANQREAVPPRPGSRKTRCVTDSAFCMRGDGSGDTMNDPVNTRSDLKLCPKHRMRYC